MPGRRPTTEELLLSLQKIRKLVESDKPGNILERMRLNQLLKEKEVLIVELIQQQVIILLDTSLVRCLIQSLRWGEKFTLLPVLEALISPFGWKLFCEQIPPLN